MDTIKLMEATPKPSPNREEPLSRLGLRVVSAFVLIPIVLGAVAAGGLLFSALCAVGCALGAVEWQRLGEARASTPASTKSPQLKPQTLLVCLAASLALPLAAFSLPVAFVLTGITAVSLWLVTAGGTKEKGWALLGLAYLLIPFLFAVDLRATPELGPTMLLFALFVVWGFDTGAYAFGRALGGPKFFPSLSPNKTWAGTLGGLFATILVAVAASALVPTASLAGLIAAALFFGILAQAGDLFESGLKRRVGVKDSGTLIPGHGGLLDRLDALLFVLPVAGLLGLIPGLLAKLWGAGG